MRVLLLSLFLLLAAGVRAADFSVTNTNDSGAGTVRQAILDANAAGGGPHTITFAPAYPLFGAIFVQSDLPVITATDVRFRGEDRSPVIGGGTNFALLRAGLNVSLDVSDINFQFGVNDNGGCIATDEVGGTGDLTVRRSFFTGCAATSGGLSGGGAIFWISDSPGLLLVEDSGFFNNSVSTTDIANEQPRGGAIYSQVTSIIRRTLFQDNAVNSTGDRGGYGGAVLIFSPAGAVSEISGSTFDTNVVDDGVTSLGWGGAARVFLGAGGLVLLEKNFFVDNSARFGGAVFLDAQEPAPSTQASMSNNTFVTNSATMSGGAADVRNLELFANHNTFYLNDAASGSHLGFNVVEVDTLIHNVLADPQSGTACDLTSTSIAGGTLAGNLFEQSCGVLSSTGGTISANLGVMEVDTGPPVGVVKFLPGADPIDGGTSDPGQCASTDARDYPRPVDSDGDGVAVCDVGAYEAPELPFFRDSYEFIPAP